MFKISILPQILFIASQLGALHVPPVLEQRVMAAVRPAAHSTGEPPLRSMDILLVPVPGADPCESSPTLSALVAPGGLWQRLVSLWWWMVWLCLRSLAGDGRQLLPAKGL